MGQITTAAGFPIAFALGTLYVAVNKPTVFAAGRRMQHFDNAGLPKAADGAMTWYWRY